MARQKKAWARPDGCRCVSEKIHEGNVYCEAKRLSKVQSINVAAELAGEIMKAIAATGTLAGEPVEATWHGGAYLVIENALGAFELRVKRLRRSS